MAHDWSRRTPIREQLGQVRLALSPPNGRMLWRSGYRLMAGPVAQRDSVVVEGDWRTAAGLGSRL